jgi:type IV secretory pathway TrbD component
MLRSYLENLLGVTLGLLVTVTASSGLASPLGFGLGEWLLVLNGIWAAAVPTVIRWLNRFDPAFGRIAEEIAKEIAKRIAEEAAKNKKKPAPKKPTPKKPGPGKGGGGGKLIAQ